ncbi:MAG: hypothetical protein IIT39_17350, partial [Clostridia bacterium]|nr:hypothetical protein [Clostridia bacterium]
MEKMTKKIWEITNELFSETYNTINTIKDQSDCFHSEMQGAEQINNLEFNNSDTSTESIPTLMNQLLVSMNNIKNGLIDQITGNDTSIAETTELQNKFLPKGKETLISSLESENNVKKYDNPED